MILVKPSQYHQHRSTQCFRHSIVCFLDVFVSVNYLNKYVQLQERADSVHVAYKVVYIFKQSQLPAAMLPRATSCTTIMQVIYLHMPTCLDARLRCAARATRRVRAGVWVLGHISRCFVRVRVAGRQDWLLPSRRRSGRAIRRPRSHDDDAMPGVDAVDAWMDEPDAPIGGPRTSVVCLITI